MKKRIIIIAGLFVVILVLWQVIRKATMDQGGPGNGGHVAIAVETGPVLRGDISNLKLFTGSLQARSEFIVAPKVSGRLEKLYVNMGDAVRRGQMIAKLDSQEYEQNVEQARAELKVAEANLAESMSALDVAERELERIRVLRDKKIASESEMDEANASYQARYAEYRVAMAQVEQREAALRAAEVRLSFTQITASWENGSNTRVIGKKFLDEGTMLRANDSIVTILDIDNLIAVINITEKDYTMIKVGQQVIITSDAYPGKDFKGKIVRMSPALSRTSRTASVEIEVPNHDRILKPGMFIRAEVELEKHQNALLVPYAAIIKRDALQGVFLIDKDGEKADFIAVETGIVTSDHAEIIKPEIEGYVVTLGHHLLDDGSEVIIQDNAEQEEISLRRKDAIK